MSLVRWIGVALGCLLAGTPARAETCGPVTITGCCQGTLLYYCAAGQLQQQDCSAAPSCGWDPAMGYYACGTAGGDDPSGKHPRICAGLADAGPPRDLPALILDMPLLPVQDMSPDTAATDIGAGPDLAGDRPGTHGEGGGGACDCRAGGAPPSSPWILALLLMPLVWSARSRRL